MNDINIGDYIIGKDQIWEIIAIEKQGINIIYDIKCISHPGDFLSDYKESIISRESVSRNHIRHLGEVVPRDSQKAIEILFGK